MQPLFGRKAANHQSETRNTTYQTLRVNFTMQAQKQIFAKKDLNKPYVLAKLPFSG